MCISIQNWQNKNQVFAKIKQVDRHPHYEILLLVLPANSPQNVVHVKIIK